MKKVIELDEVLSSRTSFSVVAVIVGIEGPKQVHFSNGTTPVVTTLLLSDGTASMDVQLSLWEMDSMRAATLRILDIVHVRDAIVKPADKNIYAIRISLHGGAAGVRFISDAVAASCVKCEGGEECAGDITHMAARVMQWRDCHFKLLTDLRQRGGIWNRDEPRHGQQLQRNVARGGETTTLKLAQKQNNGAQAVSLAVEQPTSGTTLIDIVRGKVHGCVEIDNIRVDNVYIWVKGVRRAGSKVAPRALREGCWHGCAVCCKSFNESTHHSRCDKCGGDILWHFGKIILAISDGSGKASAKMVEADLQTLLFGLTANAIRYNDKMATWASDILLSLAQDSSQFTMLVSRNYEEDGVDVRLRRLFVT